MLVPVALGVSIVCFLLVHLAPGDPINSLVSADTPKEVVDQIRKEYGLDRALPFQFLEWIGHVVTGDLGRSIATGRPVASEVRAAVGNTIVLALSAACLG